MMRNHGDAEDAVQEVFLQLLRKANTFRGESRFSTWLYRLTTNCVLMELRRKHRRRHELPCEEAFVGGRNGNPDLDSSLDTLHTPSTPMFDRVSLGAALSQLPMGFQRIVHLHDVEGYTHAEIAAFLSIQVGTSKSQLHKARRRLRRLLQTEKGSSEIR
jgi:RNA polymerase sigma-70 factor (ECF subfamily)